MRCQRLPIGSSKRSKLFASLLFLQASLEGSSAQMYLLLAIIAFLLGYATSGKEIGSTPLSQLTLDMLLAAACSVGGYLTALWAFFHSLDHDRIWPWRWSLPYLGNGMLRLGLIAALISLSIYAHDKWHLGGMASTLCLIALAISVVYLLMTSELNYFNETNPKWRKVKHPVDSDRDQAETS